MKLSLDHIKIKPFLKVLETKDFSHLSKKEKVKEKIAEHWDRLLEEFETLSGNRKKNKQLSINSRIESLKAKFNAINISCDVLLFRREQEAIEILKEHYFFLDETNYTKDIERIKKESESILIQIKKLESQLPEDKNITPGNTKHIDQVILGYCSFLGVQIKPNDCTVTEFKAMEKLFENKLKQLEKPQSNGR